MSAPAQATTSDAALSAASAALVSETPRVDHPALALYSLPNAVCGFSFMLANAYLLKYSTDALGVPVAIMGGIFFVARIWDAISDPIVGFLSDRTDSRWGRRRPWILGGAIPIALTTMMLWSPPAALTGTPLAIWMCVSYLLFFTAVTAVNVPHESLGAELSLDYGERTRVFAWRRVAFAVGALCAMAAMFVLTGSDLDTALGRVQARSDAFAVAAIAGVVTVLVSAFSVARMRERRSFQSRGATSPYAAFADVWRNPHARLLIYVFMLQQIGVMSLSVSLPYFTDYVMGDERLAPQLLGTLFGGSMVSIPLWTLVSRRFEKKRPMILAMVVVSAVMALLFGVQSEQLVLLFAGTLTAGFAAGGLDVLFPSMQADVIDFDELQTGQRKEGSYFAAWNFGQKTAAGFGALLVSSSLAAAGYRPDVPPDESVIFAIRWVFAGMPCVCFVLGTLLFARFRLDARAHAAIRAGIEARGDTR